MNKNKIIIIIVVLMIALVLASGCLKAQAPPTSATPTPTIVVKNETPKVPSVSNVNVAVVYERVTDGALYGRSNADMINLLKQVNPSFIFRGFWRWEPVPESKESAKNEISQLGGSQADLNAVINSNYTYEDLRIAISEIKQQMPNTVFVSAIPAQRIRGIEKNDLTGEILGKDKTYGMALDPTKWGISLTKDAAQKKLGGLLGWTPGDAYYPDITNPDYQTFLLDMAKKQIDSGADAIWIDMLFSQAILLENFTKDPNNIAVKESFEASSKLVDDIHAYGKTKGKNILVGSWRDSIDLPYTQPKLDFITLSPTTEMIATKTLDHIWWSDKRTSITEKFGNIPIYVFIDWANDDSPIVTFSQKLSKAEQKTFIIDAYKFFKNEGMIFVLPLHGGFMGNKASILSFGTQKVYDSMAPQFETFTTDESISSGN